MKFVCEEATTELQGLIGDCLLLFCEYFFLDIDSGEPRFLGMFSAETFSSLSPIPISMNLSTILDVCLIGAEFVSSPSTFDLISFWIQTE